jgi:hypothetical protein
LFTHEWSVRTHDHGMQRVTSQGNRKTKKMENLNKYFEESNLSQLEKDKAFNFVRKFNAGSWMESESNEMRLEGVEELFYIINEFDNKEDLYYRYRTASTYWEHIFEEQDDFNDIYIALNEISKGVFNVENFYLKNIGYILDDKGKDIGIKKIILSFSYNQKEYVKEIFADNVEAILDFINEFIGINNVSEKRFYMAQMFKMERILEHFCSIIFVTPEQIQIMDKYEFRNGFIPWNH